MSMLHTPLSSALFEGIHDQSGRTRKDSISNPGMRGAGKPISQGIFDSRCGSIWCSRWDRAEPPGGAEVCENGIGAWHRSGLDRK